MSVSKPAVEWFAKRRSDGKTLAIEHTIVEPFVGEKSDFATFSAALLEIEKDASLRVPGRGIVVFAPVGILDDKREKAEQDAVVRSIHTWIKSNRLTFPDGMSQHSCPITGMPSKAPFDVTLTVKVVSLEHGAYAESGILSVRRQQVTDTLDKVVDKALRKEVSKVINTAADKRLRRADLIFLLWRSLMKFGLSKLRFMEPLLAVHRCTLNFTIAQV